MTTLTIGAAPLTLAQLRAVLDAPCTVSLAPSAWTAVERVLWNDPATGVMRHADAGYDIAVACAREKGLDLPGIL